MQAGAERSPVGTEAFITTPLTRQAAAPPPVLLFLHPKVIHIPPFVQVDKDIPFVEVNALQLSAGPAGTSKLEAILI